MREENFLSTQFFGKEDTGNLGAVNAGPFYIALGEVKSSKVSLPKITSAKIYSRDLHSTKIHAPKIAIREFRLFPCLEPGIEFGNFPVPD
jgi:hypothetical protein